MQEEQRDIKIPIKSIVEEAMHNNGARYGEEEIMLLRKYFIACLNLGFLKPEDLKMMANKFSSQIKFIVLNYNNINKMDCYIVNGSVLYINGGLKETNTVFYETNFYKAVSQVLFNTNDEHIGISNALCEITAEKIYNMDANGSRIILPRTTEEISGNDKITLRAGYSNYNLVISLLKQLFISRKINENKIIKNMYFEGYEKVLKDIITDDNAKLLLQILDNICIMYINRIVSKKHNPNEKQLIDKYQIILNESFTEFNQSYLAFCALITSDELREKCMKKFS